MTKINFNLKMDLHNHTTWSDGDDKPEDIIKNAIDNKIDIVAITDHFCSDSERSLGFEKVKTYSSKLNKLREKYSDKIITLIGLEIEYSHLLRNQDVIPYENLNMIDFVLVENLDYIPETTSLESVGVLFNKFSCKKGLAHTDLIRLSERLKSQGGIEYILNFLEKYEVFWEINASSDHDLFIDILSPFNNNNKIKHFLESLKSREISVSAGSDTHNLVQYDIGRLMMANKLAHELNSNHG